MENVRQWLIRKVWTPLLAELRQGATPDGLAASAAVGATLAVVPIFGLTTGLCFLAGRLFRLNHVVLQLVNCVMYPAQLLLMIPFVKLGGVLTQAESLAVEPAVLVAKFTTAPADFFARFGKLLIQASVGWLLVAPIAIWLLNRILRGLLRKVSARFNLTPTEAQG